MDKVKILKNCIDFKDAQHIINHINNNLDSFDSGPRKLKFTKMFGNDHSIKDRSAKFISGIDDIEDQIKAIIKLSIGFIKDEFQETNEVYLASLWIAKQISGAKIAPHIDTDDGANEHYEYSAILYLNTPTGSSPLEFPNINLKIMPNLGDLVVFKTKNFESLHQVKDIVEDRYSIPMWFTLDKNYDLKFGAK
jgi:hypothetical protein